MALDNLSLSSGSTGCAPSSTIASNRAPMISSTEREKLEQFGMCLQKAQSSSFGAGFRNSASHSAWVISRVKIFSNWTQATSTFCAAWRASTANSSSSATVYTFSRMPPCCGWKIITHTSVMLWLRDISVRRPSA